MFEKVLAAMASSERTGTTIKEMKMKILIFLPQFFDKGNIHYDIC